METQKKRAQTVLCCALTNDGYAEATTLLPPTMTVRALKELKARILSHPGYRVHNNDYEACLIVSGQNGEKKMIKVAVRFNPHMTNATQFKLIQLIKNSVSPIRPIDTIDMTGMSYRPVH